MKCYCLKKKNLFYSSVTCGWPAVAKEEEWVVQ